LAHADSGAAGIAPEDIAEAILWLSGDASKNVSGVILPVDNAWSAL
jgi:NAD(P)-dependent dehydrogenase (short-subunit alcohol dehydrogenase family)